MAEARGFIEHFIRRLVAGASTCGHEGLPIVDIPFRYDRVLREMEEAGHVTIQWVWDDTGGRWFQLVRLEPQSPD